MPTPRPIAAASAGAEILAETTTIPLAAASAGAEFAAATTTIPGLFWDRVQRWSTRVALREKDFGVWRETTWADYGERVRACSFGLIACGLEAGERVAILSETRPEWLWADLGTLCAGGVTAGIYATDPAERCAYVVGHAGARIWVVEDQEQFDKAMQVRDDLPELRWIVVVDPKGLRQVDDARVMTFDELLERGRELERVQPELLEQRLAIIDADDMAGLFYTSGTTGPPKGVMHSHRSLLDGLELGLAEMGIGERDETLAHMPLCHLVERLFSLLMSLRCGHKVNFTENPETVFQNLQEVAPTFFCGVPRIWEILKAHVDIGMEEAVWGKRQIYRLALKIGYRRASDQLDGRDLPQWLRPLWFLANFAVFRKLRQCLGLGRARLATVGAAPVAPEVVVFFRALGVPLLEIYGQTEAGITVWTPADGVRLGKAGRPLPGMQFRCDDEGEILCKGPGLMLGYFKNPEYTAETLQDGWFHSGDVGHFDEDGYLVYEGRAKDAMVLATGRSVAPQNLENMLKASNYIMDSVVVGHGRPYLTALIVLDEEVVSHHAQTHNIPFSTYADLTGRPEIVQLIDDEVQKINRRWSDREQILDFRILRWELNSDDGELTPTLKVRRTFLCEQYADLIEEMYQKVAV